MTLPMLAVLIGLGSWQLERLHWKLGLIAEMDARLHGPEQPLEALSTQDRVDYRRVSVTGTFDYSHELFWLTPGPDGEPGYHLLTPLTLTDGALLIVDRGFIPAALKDPGTRVQSRPAGPVTLQGIARDSQKPGAFTPPDDPGQGLIYARDMERIAAGTGLPKVLPFFVEADATPNPGGYPLGGQTKVTLRNEHLNYAITWFGLAAALVMVYLLYHRSKGRL
jgi:surfeit locus 1 family protein